MISERQRNIFEFIVDFKSNNDGNSPTIREIVEGCGISSTSVVNYNLLKLAEFGIIGLSSSGAARKISIPGGRWSVRKPSLLLDPDYGTPVVVSDPVC